MSKDFTKWGGVSVEDLSSAHLRNIIRDGYRNPVIVARAKKEGLKVPEIVNYTQDEFFMFVEGCASSALEGSDFGIAITDLIHKHGMLAAREQFFLIKNRAKFDDLNS